MQTVIHSKPALSEILELQTIFFIINALIEKQKALGKLLYVCFIDFTKAFDFINRNALYYKLRERGVTDNMLGTIKSMFDSAKCVVKWNNNLSGPIDSKYGVLQGGMFSPKLFTKFLEDFSTYLNDAHGIVVDKMIIMYMFFADDLILVSETEKGLQEQINNMSRYTSIWHLIVSLVKTKIVIFNSRQVNVQDSFYYGTERIGIVHEYKYLGVYFRDTVHLLI